MASPSVLARAARGTWRVLVAKSTAVTLILVLGALTLAGTLLPQLPDEALADAVGLARWLEQVRPRLGSATDVLLRLRLLDVFHSPVFAVLAGALALSTLACTLNRTPSIWRAVRSPRHEVSAHALGHAPQVRLALAGDPHRVIREVSGHLRARHYRVGAGSAPGTLWAERFRYAALATLVAHAGLVLVLAGVGVTAMTGFREADVPIVVGETHPVGHGTELTVRALAFTDSYHQDGTPQDYASDLELVDSAGVAVRTATVRVNDPLRHDGLTIHQSGYGVAAVLQVTDGAGTVRASGGVPLRWSADEGRHAVGVLPLPALDRQLAVVAAATGRRDLAIPAGTVQVLAYSGDGATLLDQALVLLGRPAEVAGLTVTFEREQRFTALSIAREVGGSWVWFGAVLLVAGMTVTFGARPRRLWAALDTTAEPPVLVLAAPGAHGPAAEDLLADLVQRFPEHWMATDVDAETTSATVHVPISAGSPAPTR